MYIMFIVMIFYFASRVLWLMFLLFCYRSWEGMLTKAAVMNALSLEKEVYYYVILIILAGLTYAAVMVSTKNVEILKYVVLGLMVVYTMMNHQPADVLFFRDYLQAHGMWSMDYWLQQIKDVFLASPEEHEKMINGVIDEILSFFLNIWEFFSGQQKDA